MSLPQQLSPHDVAGTCVEPFPSDFEEQNRTCKVVREVVSGSSGQQVSFVKPSETSLGGIEATLSGAEQIPRPNETIIVNMTTVGPCPICYDARHRTCWPQRCVLPCLVPSTTT